MRIERRTRSNNELGSVSEENNPLRQPTVMPMRPLLGGVALILGLCATVNAKSIRLTKSGLYRVDVLWNDQAVWGTFFMVVE